MKLKGQPPRTTFEVSSGNVYADLALKDANAMIVKAELVTTMAAIIRRRGLTQAAAADILGLTQPKLSNILRGQFHGVSERRLIECLNRLGQDVEIVVKEKPRSRASGRFSITVVRPRGQPTRVATSPAASRFIGSDNREGDVARATKRLLRERLRFK